ncbi:uncharacterized protein Nmlp_2953 [Natronomonas moolapensis 8.8.11]|uniref:Uncharacterized protein n=1 Tax=Natronomonas moolapensis (strain DSM 18674 / CECT 7526 / JCM 14361 / 8.8.11) TaxID=268739 RepID=M1Y3K3_NATM8|nr:hypothetical protein [Natronomonas moolapensis]CCQ37098.1 uncharacterized protein Nmlp_2953 [Natronomonas moolapensis 8.8.11]
MPIRPIDIDTLEDACESIARENYGFIYTAEVKNEIKSAYEGADTGVLKADELSISDIRKGLSEISADEFTDFDQIRDGVFYIDQFGAVGNEEITTELTMLFSQQMVVTGERLRSVFSLAIDDLDFFVDQLESRGYLRRIRAGQNDYYTIGPKLKERANDVGLDSQLAQDAVNGKISHSDLESAIDVSATTDVIRYLETEDLIIDLDGEYLLKSLLDEYGRYLADQIESSIESEFETATYILKLNEFEQIIENEIRDQFNVLSHAREIESEIIEKTKLGLTDRLGIEVNRSVAIQTEEFEQHTEAEARRILEDIQGEIDVEPGKLDGWVEAAEEHFEQVRVSNTNAVNKQIRTEIRERYKKIVNEEKFGGMAL